MITQYEKMQICEEYKNNKRASIAVLAIKYKRNERTIRNILAENNVPITNKFRLQDDEKDQIRTMFMDGVTVSDIADKLGHQRITISRFLVSEGFKEKTNTDKEEVFGKIDVLSLDDVKTIGTKKTVLRPDLVILNANKALRKQIQGDFDNLVESKTDWKLINDILQTRYPNHIAWNYLKVYQYGWDRGINEFKWVR